MEKVKIGIIGMGRMGITHYAIINSHPDVSVEAVADPSGLITSILGKYVDVKTFSDYHDLFEKVKPDAVLVCTPPKFHYPVIKLAAEQGIHVFVEKPFTTNPKLAAELKSVFLGKRLVNQVGYVNRFNDAFAKVRSFISQGLIGNVIRFKSEMFSCTITHADKSSGWRASRESGGGAVYEMASHAIDLVHYLIGKPDKITGSSLNSIYSEAVEDVVSTTFLYKSGVTGTLYINWSDPSYRKPTNKIELFGTEGRILVDQHSIKLFLKEDNKSFSLIKGWNTLYITDIFKPVPFYVRGNEFTRQLYHFIDCVQGKTRENICSFSDGVDTLDVIQDIFDDYEKNGRIN